MFENFLSFVVEKTDFWKKN